MEGRIESLRSEATAAWRWLRDWLAVNGGRWADGTRMWLIVALLVAGAAYLDAVLFDPAQRWVLLVPMIVLFALPLAVAARQGRATKVLVCAAVIVTAVLYAKYHLRLNAEHRPGYCAEFNCYMCLIPSATVVASSHRKCCFCCDMGCTPQWAQYKAERAREREGREQM